MREYTCKCRLLVTAGDENDAYSQISDSGFVSGAVIGTVLVLSLGPVEDESGDPDDD